MFNSKELFEYKEKADNYLKVFADLRFNHYGFQAKDSEEYEYLVGSIEKYNEVHFHNRRIATFLFQNEIIELLEPKPDQEYNNSFIEHVAYATKDLERFKKLFEDSIISNFDVGETHGIKISPKQGLVIELRNNNILDSVKDFSK